MNQFEITQRFVQSYYNLYQMRMVTTKAQFCAATGTYVSNLALMSRGKRAATTEHICRLFNAYHVNPMWLFYGTGTFLQQPTESVA